MFWGLFWSFFVDYVGVPFPGWISIAFFLLYLASSLLAGLIEVQGHFIPHG
jgi:hypothetical protein